MQGGLEILCMVKVEMHPTLKNIQLLDRYEELVKIVYCEHGDLQILGSIFGNEMSLLLQSAGVSVGDTHPNKSKLNKSCKLKKIENAGHSRYVTTISNKQPTKRSYNKQNHCD